MNGLILLDEDQQRSLYGARAHHQQQPQQQQQQQQYQPQYRPMPVGRRSIPSSQGSGSEPRTDFTSRPSPRVDYTTNQGLPRTDFTTTSSSGGKPSAATFNSSPRTNFTTHRGHTDADVPSDSYPMLNGADSDDDSAADGTDGAIEATRYAGTSSGLKISVTFILFGLTVGVALGIVLSAMDVSPLVAQWVSLPGDLFLRALKCLVVPYVFCSVAVAIGDIVFVGKVSVVGMQTAKIFGMFWVSSVALGVGMALLFRPMFRIENAVAANAPNAIGLTCANGLLASMQSNETIACVSSSLTGNEAFVVSDVNNFFVENKKSQLAELSLSNQIFAMITPIVSSNIVASLANSELLSIITFAMVLGSIAGRNFFTKSRGTNYVYLVLLQLRNTFFLAMEWTIWLSPLAVVSITAGSFASSKDQLKQVGNVYAYVLAAFLAAVIQMMVMFPAIVFLLTRCNPYTYMRKMVRAYVFAFACSSSLATAPVTLTCIKKAKVCSQSLANFVISIGVTSNLSAVGFYFPIAVVFLAESSGNGDQVTVLRIIGISVLSLLSCAGTPPIPASGLVTITTIYTTVFGVSEMPSTFPYVVAMDFLLDRFATVCDVNDDIMALKVIAENTDETVTQEQLGERF